MMNVAKIFSLLLLCSVFTLGAELTEDEKEDLGDSLISAAKWENYDKVKKCLDAGADINYKGDEFSETALHWAAFKGNVGMVKLLVDRGADVNMQNKFRDTPLTLVAYRYEVGEDVCLQIMQILLNIKGVNVNQKDKDGQTALFWAALHKRVKECDLLLKYGANVNISSKDWEYPVDKVGRHKKLKRKLYPTGIHKLIHWLVTP